MRNENKNKGFTLVELIVVLVILAILAAILVPALLGYIDRAKEQQIVLHAKSCLTSAQAEFSNLYAKGEVWNGRYVDISDTDAAERIRNTADAPCDWLAIGCDKPMEENVRAGYKVTFLYYVEGDKKIYYDGTTWTTVDEWPSEVANTKCIYYVQRDSDDKAKLPE
jgi:prepilin-type N-terminal cleavage/methylation domain-containing protein